MKEDKIDGKQYLRDMIAVSKGERTPLYIRKMNRDARKAKKREAGEKREIAVGPTWGKGALWKRVITEAGYNIKWHTFIHGSVESFHGIRWDFWPSTGRFKSLKSPQVHQGSPEVFVSTMAKRRVGRCGKWEKAISEAGLKIKWFSENHGSVNHNEERWDFWPNTGSFISISNAKKGHKAFKGMNVRQFIIFLNYSKPT